MKVTDYIISFLISKGITDIFGYPGGVICHFMDSVTKYNEKISAHAMYHEQAAAFAACGYAQASGKAGVAYATSGPGATNLITGIANAYFDSIPTLFFTGQVDTYASKKTLKVRQRGFQETEIVSMVRDVTKYAINVDEPEKIRYCLEKAFYYATSGRPGPVLIDLPADVQRANVDVEKLEGFKKDEYVPKVNDGDLNTIIEFLEKSERPCLLIGNGVKQAGMKAEIVELVEKLSIPVVFSMPAFDLLKKEHELNYGFIGANGHRYGNFLLGKCDLIISIGSRLDLKQVGNAREKFAPDAQIIRIDIDENELEYKVHESDINIRAEIKELIPRMINEILIEHSNYMNWKKSCEIVRDRLKDIDNASYNNAIAQLSEMIPNESDITADVGQSQVWVAQSFKVKDRQSVHFSAGHGAMGYSLPAAIGSYYATRKPVFCFNGDGGIQMNIQELQFLKREKVPVKVIVLNNNSLGMIRGFQEANFEKNYFQTITGAGYLAPDFRKIAEAYDMKYTLIETEDDYKALSFQMDSPEFIELKLPEETWLIPNFGQNGKIQDQRPYLDRKLYDELMEV